MATTTVEEMAASFQEMGTPFIVGHPGGESVELRLSTQLILRLDGQQ